MVSGTATGDIVNTASVTPPGGTTDPTPGNDDSTDTNTNNPQADLAITKDDGVTTYTPGGTLTYTVTVTNNGPSAVTGASVTDTFPTEFASVSWTCVVAGGASVTATSTCDGSTANTGTSIADTVDLPVSSTLTYTITAVVSGTATGDIVNTASVTPPGGTTDPTPGNDDSTDTNTNNPQADLAITKDDGVTTYTPGGTLTYTVTVTNNGPSAVTGASVTDTFPTEFASVSWTCVVAGGASVTATSTCDGSTANTGTSIADTVDLPVSSTLTYTITAVVSGTATGDIVNTASVTPPGGTTDPTPGNDDSTDTNTNNPQADLAITKDDGVTTYTPGGTLTYTVTVTNNGPSAVTGASVTDTFPTEFASVSWTCVVAGGASVTATSTCDGSTANTGTSIADTVDLPVSSTLTYTITAVVSGTATGDIVNTASVTPPGGTTDPTPGNDDSTDTNTNNPQADLAITKDDGVTTYTPGGTLTYTVTVTNNGPSAVTGASVTDTFPTEFASVSWTCVVAGGASVTATSTCDGSTANTGTSIADTVDLPVSSTLTYTITAVVSGTATGDIVNTASVTPPGGTTDPTPGNDDSTDTNTDTPEPDLSVSDKTNDVGGGISLGESFTWTLTVTNSGAADATFAEDDTILIDELPANVTYGTVTVTNQTDISGAGTIACSISSDTLTCTASGGDVIIGDAPGSFDVEIPATPTQSGSFPNGASGTTCEVDPSPGVIDEVDEDNNTCPEDTVTVDMPNIEATKRDALVNDVNNNGLVDEGDTLEYTVVITNSGTVDALNVDYTDTPDTDTSLVVGSVTSTQGTVTTGNTAGDTSVAVDVGTVTASGTVTITYEVTIDTGLPSNTTQISNQGLVTGDNFIGEPTDDPTTPANDDSTSTSINQPTTQDTPTDDHDDSDDDDDDDGNDSRSSSPSILTLFDPAISKIGFLGENGVGLQGEQVEWFVTVINNGNATGTNIVVTDTMPSELSIDSVNVSPPASASVSGQTVTVTISSLAPGTNGQFQYCDHCR